MRPITLRGHGVALTLAPGLGGAVLRYGDGDGATGRQWLRPALADALAIQDPYGAAAFPLVPYSNRIRHGRFVFQDRAVTLPPNRPPAPHSIHGHGWQAAWQPVRVDAWQAELAYAHAADAWPWAYRATETIALEPGRVRLELGLTNESDAPMPAGLGWHPYLLRTPRATVTASVRGLWLVDDDVMPTEHVAPPPTLDPGRGLGVDGAALDNCFTGWDGRAVVEWPEWQAGLVVTAEPPLRCLVLYTPPGRDFFCLEPVSHVTDAINLAAGGRRDTGLVTLGPGDTLRTAITLTPWKGAGPPP